MTFNLMHFHKWNLSDIESMYPFELEVYYKLLVSYLEEQEKARRSS